MVQVSYTPSSWTLRCAYCEWYIVVSNRGMSKGDMGAGVEAANLMEYHVNKDHDKTWREYLTEKEDHPLGPVDPINEGRYDF